MTDPANAKVNSSLLIPTAGKMLAPAAVPPLKLGSGSATGNPRNKCALKPGHSLMDWIRLGNSGEDLAGTRGRVRPVSSDELAHHNRREDAWIAIRGKVYNVTRYMDFHPGGIEELMRGVGHDATKLFDEVHAWVNYQQLLAKCYIGPLRTMTKLNSIDELKADTSATKPLDLFTKPPVPGAVVPRFDWIQKRTELALYIYTRQFCNPGLILQRKSNRELHLQVQIEQHSHLFEIALQQSVDWPPKAVRVASETGKIEVTLVKTNAELWPSYGAHTVTKVTPNAEDELQHEFEVVTCQDFNHDSFELCLKSTKDTVMLLPVGYHIVMAAFVHGDLVRRSYTPVNAKYLHTPTADIANVHALHLNLLIKSYTAGSLSGHLRTLKPGAMLLLSAPRGGLNLQRLVQHRQIALLAAGSGLTPFLNLIEHLLQRSTSRLDYLHLLYFNKTERDIWCREILEHLQAVDERFHFVNVLSQPTADWSGLKGHISKDVLAPLVDKNAPEHATFMAVCGPNAFNQQAEEILRALNFKLDNFHIFQG